MKLLLLGDVCPTAVTAPLFAAKDVETLFGNTVSLFRNADFRFVNLECALTDSENAIRKFGPNLKAPKETAEVLAALGVDLCGLSNNHVFDFGCEGAHDTIRHLTEAGIAYTGFGENYADARKNFTVEKDGKTVTVIAVCEHEYSYALDDRMGSRPYDPYDTMEDIRAAKAVSDRVIVIYHGGKEHCRYPSPRVRRLCRAMAENGADLVLCQHSHCVATYEEYRGCHILHGQGNFHFVKFMGDNCPGGWNDCLAVTYDTDAGSVEFTPVCAGDNGVFLAEGEQKEALLSAFYERNRSLADGTWKAGWHDFCLKNAAPYTRAIGNAYTAEASERSDQNFSHYLDCEAHTDVWRELFPTWNHTNEKE